ncbi:MAG TPA: VTT domain-containing protein [Thermoanaerobaculia bacterium]|nr:VTT domain-containing protein [Thermoanaerobaculia bacterium]
MAATGPLHRAILSVIATAEPVIQQHPVAGAAVFVLLSAISAIVFFFSTAVITPVAVEAFGPLVALVLLWLGWIIGGIAAFGIGKRFGHRVVSWFVDPVKIHGYERRAKRLVSFRHVLLFQLAVPSEIPGYVLGLAGCRFRTFVIAMALGELPFAVGAVYLGESFLDRNYALLLAIGITGIAFSWMMFRRAAPTWSSDGNASKTRSMRLSVNDDGRDDCGNDQAEIFAYAEVKRRE